MIRIYVHKEHSKIERIVLKGHANYADFGKDIVCAGVSSILTTTVNAILSFDEDALIVQDQQDFVLTIKKHDEITSKLLENMIHLFYDLGESYPKNITIREEGK